MKFQGHLTLDREHIVQRIRFGLPERVERDGFMVIGAQPLRARHRDGWLNRALSAIRVGGRGKLVRQAREISFAPPLSGTGTLSYSIDAPNLGRIGIAIILAATAIAYSQESLTTAVFTAFFTTGLLGIGLHYMIRKSVEAYIGVAPGQFTEHRLTMG